MRLLRRVLPVVGKSIARITTGVRAASLLPDVRLGEGFSQFRPNEAAFEVGSGSQPRGDRKQQSTPMRTPPRRDKLLALSPHGGRRSARGTFAFSGATAWHAGS